MGRATWSVARQLVADQDGLGYYVWIFLGLESQGQKSDVHSMVPYRVLEWALGHLGLTRLEMWDR